MQLLCDLTWKSISKSDDKASGESHQFFSASGPHSGFSGQYFNYVHTFFIEEQRRLTR